MSNELNSKSKFIIRMCLWCGVETAFWSLLVVSESWHGEGPGKLLHPLAELCDTRHRLWVLQQEGLEACQIPCCETEETKH